jgi:hypothetical protein
VVTEVKTLSSVPVRASFWVLADARLAVLDRAFADRAGRWPEINEALISRVTDRTRRLTYNLATQRSKRVDERLWLALWHLADRWGTVRPGGVELRLPGLSHRVLGSLIAARRPSITTAIGHLVDGGLLEAPITAASSCWVSPQRRSSARGPPLTPVSPSADARRRDRRVCRGQFLSTTAAAMRPKATARAR